MTPHASAAALLSLAVLASPSHAQPEGKSRELPELVGQMLPEVADRAPQAQQSAATEQLPSLEQMKVWYRIQREKLGDDAREVKDLAAMIAALSPPTFSVEFPGGSVAQYIDAIRAAYPEANIVGVQGLEHVTVPGITLREVSLEGALRPLTVVARTVDGRSADLGVFFMNGVASIAIPERSLPEPPRTLVLSGESLRETGLPMPQIHEVFQTALSIFPGPQPDARFHEGTGIVVVRGTPEQLRTVEEVIEKLRMSARDAAARNQALRERHELLDRMRQEVRATELLIQHLEARRQGMEVGSESDAIDEELVERRKMLDEGRARVQAAVEALESAKDRAQAPGS